MGKNIIEAFKLKYAGILPYTLLLAGEVSRDSLSILSNPFWWCTVLGGCYKLMCEWQFMLYTAQMKFEEGTVEALLFSLRTFQF